MGFEPIIIFMSCFSFLATMYLLFVKSGKQSERDVLSLIINEKIQKQMNSNIYMLAVRVLEGKKKTPPEFENRLKEIVVSAKEIYEATKKAEETK